MGAQLGEQLDDALARIAEREADVAAWVHRCPEAHVRAAAAAAPEGPLHGVTLGVKDIIDTADLPTERGSPIYAWRRPEADAACVAMARAAGAVVLGKTVTTELAMLTPAQTRNPHNLAHTPGGSSSGSAAAVADGMVRIGFGTQTAGSVIRPAAFCGVVGFKPTHNLVPLAGVNLLSQSLDTLGWLSRTCDDAAAMLAALTGRAVSPMRRAPRLGVYRSREWDKAQPSTAAALAVAAEALAADGAEVVDVAPLPALAALGRAQYTIMTYEASRALAWERSRHRDRLSLGLRSWVEAGDAISAEAYDSAQGLAAAGRAALADAFDHGRLDALLTPSAPGEAPAGLDSTGDPVFCRVWTLLGGPCLTLPAGRGPLGLPVGVQLVGRRGGDAELLALGAWAQARLDPDRSLVGPGGPQ
ncbi:MAG: amidase [Acidimicrobiales bacterium]